MLPSYNLYDIVYTKDNTFRIIMLDDIMDRAVLRKQRWDPKLKMYVPDEKSKPFEEFMNDLRLYEKLPKVNGKEQPLLRDEERGIFLKHTKIIAP